jgi:hypothetical protein
LNFAVANPHSNLDMACAVKYTVPKLPQALIMGLKWKGRSVLKEIEVTGPQCG